MSRLYTAQISKWRELEAAGITLVDVTVRSGIQAFAPTWEMVAGYKDGNISPEKYTELYSAMMMESQDKHRDEWMKLLNMVVDTGAVALGCYCTPGDFCHRCILLKYLVDFAVDEGVYLEICGEWGTWAPHRDGIDHINIYTKGHSGLGRWLSNLAESPFTYEEVSYGSMEAYWYARKLKEVCPEGGYLDDPRYRTLLGSHGFSCKKLGRGLVTGYTKGIFASDFKTLVFKRDILRAFKAKVQQSPKEFRDKFIASTLPFAHYYYYGELKNAKVVKTDDEWLVEGISKYRKELKNAVKE